jgi:hypothetical protein
MFYVIHASDKNSAFHVASTVCRCVRDSFIGVRWKAQNNAMITWTWSQVDEMIANGGPT